MTEQEERNVEFQRQIDLQNARIDKIDLKIDNLVKSLDDFKQEMRDKDNQRAAEMAEIRSSLQNLQLSGRNTNIMMFLGIAAMVIAVLLK